MSPLPPTDRLDVVTEWLYNLMLSQQATLGVADVFYGEQHKIPRTPCICVVPDNKEREGQGAPRMVRNTFQVRIDIYISKVQDIQDNEREGNILAENVETIIHQDVTFGGLVYGSLVVSNTSGYLTRANSQFRGNRLSIVSQSKTMLPMRPGYNQ